MIYPTEMTLATGTTVYAGDPESDERIQSREVRVSVTYRIEEDEDFDLADFAHARAAEVERARIAAQERIQEQIATQKQIAARDCIERNRTAPYRTSFDPNDAPFDPNDPALEPPDMDPPNEDTDAPDPFPEEANYLGSHISDSHLSARCGPALIDRFPAPSGGCPGNGSRTRNGHSALPPSVPAGTVKIPDAVSAEETDWATKPQVLALGSHFRRLGLSPENQTALLRARYGKFRPERLTKDEAAGLMRCLERGEWEMSETALAH